jgi:hypothetical protein
MTSTVKYVVSHGRDQATTLTLPNRDVGSIKILREEDRPNEYDTGKGGNMAS